MSGQVRLRRDGVTGTILLDHPARMNALTPGMISDIRRGLEDFHSDSRVRVIVLTGSGASFCTGTDLNTVTLPPPGEAPLEDLPQDIAGLLELVEAMLRYPRPLLAAVTGWVAGSGLTLMLACDLVVAGVDTRFWIPEPRLGLSPALSMPLLLRRVRQGFAAQMLLGGNPVDAARGLAGGLADEVQPDHLVWARAHELADEIAAGSPAAHQMTRRVLHEVMGENLFTQLNVAAACVAAARTTPAAAAGVTAFLARHNR